MSKVCKVESILGSLHKTENIASQGLAYSRHVVSLRANLNFAVA